MPPLLPILLEILPAVLLSAVALILGGRLASRDRKRSAGWSALAIGGGYLAGHFALRGWRGWAPKESTDWIAVCALLGLLIGLSAWTRHGRASAAFVLRWMAATAVVWLVIGKVLLREETASYAWGEMALIGLAAAVVWSFLETQAMPIRVGPTLLLCVVSIGVSGALLLSASAVLAQLAGALAAALGAAVGVGILFRAPLQIRPAVPAVVTTLLALLTAGVVYAQLPSAAAMMLGAAPFAIAIERAPGVQRLPRSVQLAGSLLLTLVPIALSLLLANQAVSSWDEY